MIFWVEVNRNIGMGHLMECLALAEEAEARGAGIHFVITPFEPAQALLRKLGRHYDTAPLDGGVEALEDFAPGKAPGMAVIDHRSVELAQLCQLRQRGWSVAVIDQLGNKPMICDMLFNASLVADFRVYEFPEGLAECRFGPSFALLRSEFAVLNGREKNFPGAPYKIVVTMGGVDRTGATFNVMEALAGLGGHVRKEIITGEGFPHLARLEQVKRQCDDSFSFATGVDDMGERLFAADLAISAGGNTLLECACAGTPAIVLGEDDHENRQGAAFAGEGAVINLRAGASTDVLDMMGNIVSGLLENEAERKRMSRRGRKIVDGRGVSRVCEELLSRDGN